MKIKFLIIIICVSFLNIFAAEKMLRKVLPNGLEVVVKENHQNQSVGFFCFVKTGSANEGKLLGCGISHYLEHLVAGGTTKFHTENDYKVMNQQSGAISNAYTNSNATVFHIITNKDFGDQTLTNLAEQIGYCALDSFEVAREKEVILKEIVMGSTSPEDRIPARRDELLYQISNQKYPVIGFVEAFKKITHKDLSEYYKRHYVPNNMVFVAVGSFDAAEMLAKVEKNFAQMPRGNIAPEANPAEPLKQGSLTISEDYDISLPIIYISYILPQMSATESFALSTALDLLFEKRESPISYRLNEELKLVNQSWSYAQPADNFNREGVAMIGLEARDSKSVDQIIKVIDSELQKAAVRGFTKEQIAQNIDRIERAKIVRISDIDSEANEIGWDMLNYGITNYHQVRIDFLKKLTPADLKTALQNFLKQGRLIYKAMPLDTAGLRDSVQDKAENFQTEEIKVNDKITLLYKKSDIKPVVYASIFFPLSSDYETKETKGYISMLNRMIIRGSLKYPPLWLSGWLENKMADLRVETYDYGTFIKFKCLKKDYLELEKIIVDLLKNPSFKTAELAMVKDEMEAEFQRSQNDPEESHSQYLNSILYKNKRSAVSNAETNQKLQKLTVTDLKLLYKKYFKAETVTASIIGDISRDEAQSTLKNIAAAIPAGQINDKIESDSPLELNAVYEAKYPFEEVALTINYPAPKIGDADFKTMLVIQNILNGNIGRIYEAARGKNDLAYSAYSYYRYRASTGSLVINTQTTADKKDALLKVLLAVMEDLKAGNVTEAEIEAAIADWQRSYLNDMTDDYWPSTYVKNQALGLGYNFVQNYRSFLGKITPDDVKETANKYFKNAAIFVSLPDESVETIVK